MSRITKLLLCIVLSVPAFASADSSKEVAGAISAWEPKQVSQQDQRITIVLFDSPVTDTIYQNVIRNGVCMPIWLKYASSSYLANVTEIAVLNRTQTQGFVLEGGLKECERLGFIPGSAVNAELASVTRAL